MKARALPAIVALVAAAACAGGSGGGPPATVPQRIVSLVPAATQVLFALDAGPRVVGVSSYDTRPPEVLELPRVGALLDPDTERILALQPHLVIVDPSHQALARQLRALDIGVLAWATGDIEGFYGQLDALGAAIDAAPAAADLALRLREELAAVAAGAPAASRPRTLLVFGRSPGSFSGLWVSGGEGFLHDLVEIAGGENVFGDQPMQSFKAGVEVLVASPPAVVIETAAEEVGSTAAIEAEWRSLPGFENVTVAVVAGPDVLVPGPNMGETARAIAVAIGAAAATGRSR